MIKNRSFMSGLGIGLIIGAILLQLMVIGEGQASLSKDQSSSILTREQIEEKAKELDLKVTDSSEQLLTEEEWKQQTLDQGAQTQGDPIITSPNTESVTEPDQPTTPQQPEQDSGKTSSQVVSPPVAQSAVPTKTPSAPLKTEEAQMIEYKIKKGSNLTNVAEDLKRIGVISNSEQFIKTAVGEKINRSIRDGSFTFYKGESNESIISKIRTPSSR